MDKCMQPLSVSSDAQYNSQEAASIEKAERIHLPLLHSYQESACVYYGEYKQAQEHKKHEWGQDNLNCKILIFAHDILKTICKLHF